MFVLSQYHDFTLHGCSLSLQIAFFLYTGPESMLPLTSGIAAIIGLVLMGWQRLSAAVLRMLHRKSAESFHSTSKQK